jgi:hypothetical protein
MCIMYMLLFFLGIKGDRNLTYSLMFFIFYTLHIFFYFKKIIIWQQFFDVQIVGVMIGHMLNQEQLYT